MKYLVVIACCLLGMYPASLPSQVAQQKSGDEIDRLIRQLGDHDYETREQAGKRLLQVGEPALDALWAAERSEDQEIARRAETLASKIGTPLLTKELRQMKAGTGTLPRTCLLSAEFSPDGRSILSSSGLIITANEFQYWNVQDGKLLRRWQAKDSLVPVIKIAPNGTCAASASKDGSVLLWDLKTGKEIRRFTGHATAVTALAFSSNGSRLLSGGGDDTVRLWNVADGKEIHCLKGHGSYVTSVAFSPREHRVAISGSSDRTIRLWDLETGVEVRVLKGHEDGVLSVCFTPDGRHFYSSSADASIRFWDIDKEKAERALVGHTAPVWSVCVSPDGKYLLSAAGSGPGSPNIPEESPQTPKRADLSDCTVRLWKVATGKELHQFQGHAGAVRCVTFSPDGRYALSASSDETLRLWRLPKK